MKMADDVVRIVVERVESTVRECYTSEATKTETYEKQSYNYQIRA